MSPMPEIRSQSRPLLPLLKKREMRSAPHLSSVQEARRDRSDIAKIVEVFIHSVNFRWCMFAHKLDQPSRQGQRISQKQQLDSHEESQSSQTTSSNLFSSSSQIFHAIFFPGYTFSNAVHLCEARPPFWLNPSPKLDRKNYFPILLILHFPFGVQRRSVRLILREWRSCW